MEQSEPPPELLLQKKALTFRMMLRASLLIAFGILNAVNVEISQQKTQSTRIQLATSFVLDSTSKTVESLTVGFRVYGFNWANVLCVLKANDATHFTLSGIVDGRRHLKCSQTENA
ncbi:hypothetical protein ACJJTC_003342 [Scirpophaga incertulas]